jgi:Ca2+-binding RTX toxin-like protein
MPIRNGDASNNNIDLRGEPSTQPADWPENQAWWQVDAKEGNDTVHGSVDNDSIHGGDGIDVLNGYDGNDGLYGDAGDDVLSGGNGEDWLDGGIGDDDLYGGNNDDWLTGQAGDDYMEGGSGNDVLVGGAGADTMFGQAGDDQFFGEDGIDVMDGGAGNDRLWGGAGNDRYQFNGMGFDYVNDGVTPTGAPRTDTVFDTQDRLTVSYATAEVQFFVSGGDDLLITSSNDTADGIIDNAVIIEDYFQGGHFVIDILQTNDGAHNLPALIPPVLA